MHIRIRKIAPRGALLAMLAAALLSAGAAAQSREAMLLTDKRPPRRGCQVERRNVPTAELVDSAALHAAVAAYHAERPMGDSAYILYSLRVNEAGSVVSMHLLEAYLPEGADQELRALVQPHLRTGARNIKAFRIRLTPGSATAPVRVGRSEICQPGGLRTVEFSAPMGANLVKPGNVRVRTRVSATGEILGVHPISGSGIDGYDQSVISYLMSRPVNPGLVDGIPAEMEYEQTVMYRDRG